MIDEVTIHGKAQQPAVIVRLIRGFLQRLRLPRLLHFLDLVLPQMVPVCSPAQATGLQFPGSQLIRDSCGAKSLVRNRSGLTLLSVPLALLFCGWP